MSFEISSDAASAPDGGRFAALRPPLQHQDVSSAALAAVKSNVFVAGVWMKPADALLTAEEA